MANDLNQCNFIGRLGRDPEIRYMPSGDAVASFSIAVGSSWKDKNSGEKKEQTEWVSITAFGKLAEIIGQYVKKGSKVFITGRMKTDKYEKDGVERYSTKIIAEQMQMLDSKGEGGNGAQQHEQGAASSQRPAPAARPANSRPAPNFSDMDDDIPF